MPTISMFYGVIVNMYALDTDRHHHPHVHARYNEHKVVLRIPDGEVLVGFGVNLPTTYHCLKTLP